MEDLYLCDEIMEFSIEREAFRIFYSCLNDLYSSIVDLISGVASIIPVNMK